MSTVRNDSPLSTAFAAGTVLRAAGVRAWRFPEMAPRTASFPIHRGVLR